MGQIYFDGERKSFTKSDEKRFCTKKLFESKVTNNNGALSSSARKIIIDVEDTKKETDFLPTWQNNPNDRNFHKSKKKKKHENKQRKSQIFKNFLFEFL